MEEDLYWSLYHHQRCGTCVYGWRFKPSSIQLITFVGKKACGGISRRFVDKLFILAIIAN